VPKDLLQLFLGVHQVKRDPGSLVFEHHEHIHVAVRSKVIPQCRAKDGKLLDLPLWQKSAILSWGMPIWMLMLIPPPAEQAHLVRQLRRPG